MTTRQFDVARTQFDGKQLTALPGELWGRFCWKKSRLFTTAMVDDAAPAANDSTSRTEDQLQVGVWPIF